MNKLFAFLLLLLSAAAWSQVIEQKTPTSLPPISPNTVLCNATGSTAAPTACAKREFDIKDFGAKCDGSTDDSTAINSAEAAAAAVGGGTVTGQGTCAVANGMLYGDSRIVFASKHYGDGSHDVGSNDSGWVLKWTGSVGGTILTITAPTGAGNQALYGNGARGITFDCANSAAVGLSLGSVKGGEWSGLYFLECTTAGLYTIPVSPLGEASDVQGNRFFGIHTRILLSTGIGVELMGISGHDTSFDSFRDLQIIYKNGAGIRLGVTDNITFENVQESRVSGGTANGVDLSGDANGSAQSISFRDLSPGAGGVLIEGTGTITTAVKNVQFLGYDVANNAPAPSLGTGVTGITTYKENGHISGAGMLTAGFGESDANISNAITNCPAGASACIYNTSQDGLHFFDGTSNWVARLDSSHNLNFFRSSGSGFFLFSNPLEYTGALISAGTTFTLGTGTGACATTSTLTGGQSTGSFLCTGTAGASTIVINLPSGGVGHGWQCSGGDVTSGVAWAQVTPISTSSCKLTGTIATTSDQVNFNAMAY